MMDYLNKTLIISSKCIKIALGGDNMLKSTSMLSEELKEYVNTGAKIRQLVDKQKLIPIVRGLYETNADIPGYCLAQVIYGPSYLSFDYALAFYSLIPEAVYNYTSATFEKKKMKRYDTLFGTFTYRDVPSLVYPVGVDYRVEYGYGFQIASPEKALCDKLYTISPLQSRRELEQLLFSDLRIDADELFKLDLPKLLDITSRYKTKNHKLLYSYLARSVKNEFSH